MISMKKTLFLSAALASLSIMAIGAHAETVIQNTTVSQVNLPHTERINFEAFDLNHDGVLSRQEVGEKLFYVFDTDGNQGIDNLEYKRKTVLTIIPMQKQTITAYDYNSDGHIDATETSTSDFIEKSGLARFAKNGETGISPQDFLKGKAFNEVDVNHDGVIDLKEWKGAYIASLDKANREAARYNQ